MRFVLFVLIASLAGCVETGGSTDFDWTVHNDGPASIDFEAMIAGDSSSAKTSGTVPAGGFRTFQHSVSGVDLTATIQLAGDARESSGVPFAADDLCTYMIEARWDGEEWDIDVAPMVCV